MESRFRGPNRGTTAFKLTARHAASVVAVVASFYFTASQMQNDKLRQQRDLEMSSAVLSESLRAAFKPLFQASDRRGMQMLAQEFENRGRLAGVVLYDASGEVVAATNGLGRRLTTMPPAVAACIKDGTESDGYILLGPARMRVNALSISGGRAGGVLAVFHDTAYIENRLARSRWNSVRRMSIQAVLFLGAVWAFGLLLK